MNYMNRNISASFAVPGGIPSEKKRAARTLTELVIALLLREPIGIAVAYIFDAVMFLVTARFTLSPTEIAVTDWLYEALTYVLGLAIPFTVFLLYRRHKGEESLYPSELENRSGEKRRLFMIFPLYFSTRAASMFCSTMVVYLSFVLHLDAIGIDMTQGTEELEALPADMLGILLQFVLIGVLPAILEEFFFRHVMLGALLPFGKEFAILMSSLLFGLCHRGFEGIAFAFAFGMGFAFAAVKFRSILPGMVFHCLTNCMALAAQYVESYLGDEVYGIYGTADMLIITALGILSICLLVSKRFLTLEKDAEDENGSRDRRSVFSSIKTPAMIVFFIYTAAANVFSYYV